MPDPFKSAIADINQALNKLMNVEIIGLPALTEEQQAIVDKLQGIKWELKQFVREDD